MWKVSGSGKSLIKRKLLIIHCVLISERWVVGRGSCSYQSRTCLRQECLCHKNKINKKIDLKETIGRPMIKANQLSLCLLQRFVSTCILVAHTNYLSNMLLSTLPYYLLHNLFFLIFHSYFYAACYMVFSRNFSIFGFKQTFVLRQFTLESIDRNGKVSQSVLSWLWKFG